jgi:hypothetical protein
MSLKQKLKQELDKISALKGVKAMLTPIILNLMRENYSQAQSYLPAMKELMTDMIDSIWKIGERTLTIIRHSSNENLQILDNSYDKNPSLSHESHEVNRVPSNPSQRRIKASVPLVLVSQGEKKFTEVLSEFSYSSGPSFSRSIREIHRKRDITPGPACYDPSKAGRKPNAPKVVFPVVTKRDSYIPVSYSPGPAKYYSSIHYLAKG